MTKDKSTKRASTSGSSLADHIAAILEDPDTPPDLYNSIAEVVTELTAKHQLSREVLRVSLPLALGHPRPRTKKGGAS